jgi:hypothetical protein
MSSQLDPQLHSAVKSIYEEVMWLARRPNVTPARARSWYTHVMAEAVKRRLRRFTGQVSEAAAKDGEVPLRLEHFKRIQTTLTAFVEQHRNKGVKNSEAFIGILVDCEQVHIVTRDENYAVLRAEGDYEKAGVALLSWEKLSEERRLQLWRRMLHGKVSNADAFRPKSDVSKRASVRNP